jgi:hypothetical protein
MNTSIYTKQGLHLLTQIVNIWVDALLSRRMMKRISLEVCRFSGQYSFQASLYVGYATC